jgi:4-hydroxythreonine-4-phosphate dehydrogenase
MAGVPFRDHTDFLIARTHAQRAGMWLEGRGLRTVLATRHIPLGDAARLLSVGSVVEAAELAYGALTRDLRIPRPRLGLCALNPHAGDDGIIGREEALILGPALRRLKGRGVPIRGPIPADAAWAAHAAGRFDALVSLYHDQALIPLKLWAGYSIVNWTLGVPIVRASPGHGTAFELAGKNRADASGMVEAALLAARVAAGRIR